MREGWEELKVLLRRVPSAGWICSLVALLCGIAWAIIVPPFQFADEPRHVAYVQYLAETGKPPTGKFGLMGRSPEEQRIQRALGYNQRRLEMRANTSPADQEQIEKAVDSGASRESEGGYTTATNNPPLYYALEAVVYHASPSSSLLDRLTLMRLFSALLGAMTVLLSFLFVREMLPGTPWAWSIGGLAVALQPQFGNESGTVNSDNLLFTMTAAIFLMLAVCFRRGLTPGRGALLGIVCAGGLLSKATTLGILPGVLLGVLLMIWRASPDARREAWRGALTGVAVAAVPILIYMYFNAEVWDRGLLLGNGNSLPIPASHAIPVPAGTASNPITGTLSYIWQFYLPRLGFMVPVHGFDYWPAGHIWFGGFVGRFGALEFGLPGVAYAVAAVVYIAMLLLAGRELLHRVPALKRRWPEWATYLAMLAGLLVGIHSVGYGVRLRDEGDWEQARYLFPMLPLYAALIAVGIRGAGRRFGPAVGVLFVSFAIAHTALALLVTLNRYYG
jgi:4-amino-4-deoxy-L-arabinose transferase-like glycosyltransferase